MPPTAECPVCGHSNGWKKRLFSNRISKIRNMKNSNNIHYGYVIVLCCFLIMFVVVGLIMSCAGIFYKPVSEELGIDIGKFGLYMSLNFLFSTLTLSFAGKLMERYSARSIMAVSSATAGAGLMAMSQFNAVWQFYIAGAVFGITLAFLLYLGFPTLLNRWFKARMGVFIGICSAGSGIGGVLFNPIVGYLITNYEWRATYLIFGVLILLLVTPVLALFLRNYPKDKGLQPYGASATHATAVTVATDSRTGDQKKGIAYAKAIRMPVFYGLVLFAVLINAAATLNVFVPAYVQSIRFSIEQASFAASAVMVGVTVGKVILGMINDRSTGWGVVATTALGVGGLAILLMGHIGIVVTIIGGFLFGWAYAGVSVQTPLLVRSVFGNRNYAQIYSNISMAIAIGGAIAAGGWGLLADATSFGFILTTGIVFLIVSGAIGLYALKINNNNTKKN